ncbi:hypothetical protein AU510_17250 [Lonsdalea britannica]|nr:hypothetical protein AU510_17250 [Lonsdalea britannica]
MLFCMAIREQEPIFIRALGNPFEVENLTLQYIADGTIQMIFLSLQIYTHTKKPQTLFNVALSIQYL